MRAAKELEKAQQTRYHSARNALEEALRVADQPLSPSLSLSLINEVPLVCNACFGPDCVCYIDSPQLVAKVEDRFTGSGVSGRLPRKHLGHRRYKSYLANPTYHSLFTPVKR